MNFQHLCTPSEHQLSRRQWLGSVAAGTLGLSGLAAPALAEELKKKDRQVLFVWLDGGISQLESWDPKPRTDFGGPYRAIPTSVTGLHVCELLPRTARQMHRLAVIRSMCTKDNTHSAGVARIQRGDPKNRGVTYPYLGSAVANRLGPSSNALPPYVVIKPGSGGFFYQDAGFLGPQYGAVAFGDGKPPDNLLLNASVAEADDEARNDLRERADRRYAELHRKEWTEANRHVFRMAAELRKRADLFDASRFSARDVERYGTHEFGRHMLLARQMLESGVRFVKVASTGWDSHGDNFNAHRSMVPKFDQAFAAMVEDLAQRGMLEHVLVIAMSEFGRTPRINGHLGRDHWPEAWSLVMGGCGVRPGVVVGKTNELGTYVADKELDIGHMFHTWFRALGVNPKERDYDNNGQPLPVAREDCHPVKELLI